MPFVEEVGRNLTGRLWDIWRGHDDAGTPVLTPEKCEAYRRAWRGQPPAPRPVARAARPPARPACPHLGEPTGETVGCRTCSRERLPVYGCGLHGLTVLEKAPTSAAVRCCKHCDDNPANVARRARRDPWGHPVTVPAPPVPPMPRRSPLAVVTCAAGPEGRDLLAVSGPWLRAYAARLGADFIALDWPGAAGFPLSAKFALHHVVAAYERTAFLDADTVADPDLAPDLFALVPADSVGIYDDLPGLLRGTAGAGLVAHEYQRFREVTGLGRVSVGFYGNTGVMAFARGHAPLLAPPTVPVPPLHCGEQHWLVARLVDSGVPLFRLPATCNYQWWEFDGFRGPQPREAVFHFSGIRPGKTAAERVAVMRETITRLGLAR